MAFSAPAAHPFAAPLEATAYQEPLSRFAATLSFHDLPPAVRLQAAWVIADTVAAIVAGSAEPELRALAQRLGHGSGATLLGLGREATPDVAALVNGTAGTFLEMDEGNRFSRGHPAIHVLPAALALCEQQGASADTFLSAFVVGYEVGSRLGAATQLRGSMHPHGTWGTVGAAAACARVLSFDAVAMRETLNISSSLTIATSKKTMLQGGLVRNVYAGLSNRQGLLAVQLAASGFTGERDGLASVFGEVVSERFDRAVLLQDLGDDWHLLHNYFKLHSCCRFNHGTLDALDTIAAAGLLPQPEEIARIQVTSYHYAAELDDKAPRNTLAAKFSIPFAVATRIVRGSSALASFTWDAVRDARILALAQKVDVAEDPAMSRRLPNERPARVEITTTDGSTRSAEVGVNRGDDAAPYSHDELTTKFMDLTGRVWPQAHAQQVLQATLALCDVEASADGAQALQQWLALLRHAPLA